MTGLKRRKHEEWGKEVLGRHIENLERNKEKGEIEGRYWGAVRRTKKLLHQVNDNLRVSGEKKTRGRTLPIVGGGEFH